MAPDTLHLVPRLPNVGDTPFLFGMFWRVTVVEPAADYAWSVEAVNGNGETMTITIPTDERTV